MTEEQQRSKANIYHSRIRVDIGLSPFRRLSGGDVGTKLMTTVPVVLKRTVRAMISRQGA